MYNEMTICPGSRFDLFKTSRQIEITDVTVFVQGSKIETTVLFKDLSGSSQMAMRLDLFIEWMNEENAENSFV